MKVVVDERVEHITNFNCITNGYFSQVGDKLTRLHVHSESITIQIYVFSTPTLKEIMFQEKCNLIIERLEFYGCKNLSVIK